MHTALATLLKSKKPLPVPVIAQAIAKMVMRAKTILITFRMILFFTQLHPKSIFFHGNINNSDRRAVDSTAQVASAYFITRL